MKKTTLLLSLATTALLAEDVQLKDLTISSADEPTVFETHEVEYKPEVSTTLPSNMLLKASSSGIKIDGAAADFTSVYWNGIEVTDPSSINNYPTLMNYGRSGSDVVSIDGSNINYKTKEDRTIEVEGGTPQFIRVHAATTFETNNTTQTLRLDGIQTKLNSAYTAHSGSFDAGEEKDASKTLDLSYLGRFTFAERYSSSLSILHKEVNYDYDGYNPVTYKQDPNDTTASFDSKLSIVGADIGYDKDDNILKFDLQGVRSKRKSLNPTLASQVNRFGLKGIYNIKDFDTKIKASAHTVKEHAEISNKNYNRRYNEYKLALIYDSEYAKLNVNGEKSYKDTYSTLVALSVPIYYGVSYLAKYENKGVNPSIVQEEPIYTIENRDLKSQKLKKYAGGFEYISEDKDIQLRTTYAKIYTDDMIAYVTVDPATYTAQYQNVDKTDYDFIQAEAYFTFLDTFTISEDYSNIRNITSSKPSLNYNLPKHRSVTKLSYEDKNFSAYLLVNYTSLQKTYGGNVDPSVVANAGAGYMFNEDLEIRADIYNLTNAYYEYVASYPQNPRIITATLKYNF